MTHAWYRTVQNVLSEGQTSVTRVRLAIFHWMSRMSRHALIVTLAQLNSFVKNARTKSIVIHAQLDTVMSLVHAKNVMWKHVQNVMQTQVSVNSAKKVFI